jgi:hypothetical protein
MLLIIPVLPSREWLRAKGNRYKMETETPCFLLLLVNLMGHAFQQNYEYLLYYTQGPKLPLRNSRVRTAYSSKRGQLPIMMRLHTGAEVIMFWEPSSPLK